MLLINSQTPSGHCERLLSTHGVGVMESIELARITHPDRAAQRIFIVGITVQTSRRGKGLSPPVLNAVPIAATQALALAGSQ